jgi:ribulose-phosphate 3-epimerase
MVKVAPSILNANFLELGKVIDLLNLSEADYIHLDIMDGHFVDNLSFGPEIIKQVRKVTKKTLDAHLMISHPEKYIEVFAAAGCDIITVHCEISHPVQDILQQIKQAGCKVGVSLKPSTPAVDLEPLYEMIDQVLVMTVDPGFGGQAFIKEQLSKIAEIHSEIKRRNLAIDIEVDGGINLATARETVACGADVLVAGSFIFSAPDPLAQISELKKIC